jgi:cell wall-associated NlpC family hydrolase
MATGQDIVDKAMEQDGKPYIFGYEVDLDDPDPKAFDCSELTQWVSYQLRVSPEMPDGAIYQMRHCRNHDLLISVTQAVKTPGALLFRISEGGNHVAISRGDGTTIEARGKAYGVGSWSATKGRAWTHAGLIPGVEYGI